MYPTKQYSLFEKWEIRGRSSRRKNIQARDELELLCSYIAPLVDTKEILSVVLRHLQRRVKEISLIRPKQILLFAIFNGWLIGKYCSNCIISKLNRH